MTFHMSPANDFDLPAEAIDLDASEPTNLNPSDLDIHDDAMTDGFYVPSKAAPYLFVWREGLDHIEQAHGA